MKLRAAAAGDANDGAGDAGGIAGGAAAVLPTTLRPGAAAASGWRRQGLGCVLWPLGVLTLLLVLDIARRRGVHLCFSGGAPAAGGGAAGAAWLQAASSRGTKAEWYSSLADMAAWKLADWEIAMRMPGHAQEGFDEYGRPTFARLCSQAAAGQDPGWPLAPDSGYADARALCAAVDALRSSLRIYTHRLPRSVTRTGPLPALAPYFNRGYPVEAYLLRHMSHGPFSTRDAAAANAFLLPVAPYSLRVAAFPGDGLTGVQARVAAAVEAVKASAPGVWAAHRACDHVLVSAHDKGGRVAQTADRALIDHAVLIVNTADTHGEANEWGRYTKGKDVAGICSFSTSLPAWAAALGACGAPPPGSPPPPPRTQLLSFVGGGLGSVRQALFAHYAEHPWPDLLMVRHHLAPKEYMHVLMTSKFCLHVRGTQVQSPRLLEILLFGCVPVIMADTYDLPLSDVLDWRAFSVRVPQGEPGALPAALAKADYESLRATACAVAPFFAYHARPTPGDAFHMTMLQLARRLAAAPSRPGCALNATAALRLN